MNKRLWLFLAVCILVVGVSEAGIAQGINLLTNGLGAVGGKKLKNVLPLLLMGMMHRPTFMPVPVPVPMQGAAGGHQHQHTNQIPVYPVYGQAQAYGQQQQVGWW